MYQPDFDNFGKLMRTLAEVFGKQLTDEIIQAYWRALKDRTFASVSELADKHVRYGKFFPKPFELRPKGDKPQEKREIGLDKADRRAIKRLEEQRIKDPEGWFKEFSDPDCFAVKIARQYGVHNIWYDLEGCTWMAHDEMGQTTRLHPTHH